MRMPLFVNAAGENIRTRRIYLQISHGSLDVTGKLMSRKAV